jgi:hypothetical protein
MHVTKDIWNGIRKKKHIREDLSEKVTLQGKPKKKKRISKTGMR